MDSRARRSTGRCADGVTSLVVTGTMPGLCVPATVIGAFNREYRLTVVEDAVATLRPDISAWGGTHS